MRKDKGDWEEREDKEDSLDLKYNKHKEFLFYHAPLSINTKSYNLFNSNEGCVMSKKLEKLLQKREQLNAEIQKARARETAQKRKEDTRRKILLGALVIEMMDKGELDDEVIMKRLEGFLTRDIDRKLFNFPFKGDSVEKD